MRQWRRTGKGTARGTHECAIRRAHGVVWQPFSELGPYVGVGVKHLKGAIDGFVWSIWVPVSCCSMAIGASPFGGSV